MRTPHPQSLYQQPSCAYHYHAHVLRQGLNKEL